MSEISETLNQYKKSMILRKSTVPDPQSWRLILLLYTFPRQNMATLEVGHTTSELMKTQICNQAARNMPVTPNKAENSMIKASEFEKLSKWPLKIGKMCPFFMGKNENSPKFWARYTYHGDIIMVNLLWFQEKNHGDLTSMTLTLCPRCPSHDDYWMHAHKLATKAGIHLHLHHIASTQKDAL